MSKKPTRKTKSKTKSKPAAKRSPLPKKNYVVPPEQPVYYWKSNDGVVRNLNEMSWDHLNNLFIHLLRTQLSTYQDFPQTRTEDIYVQGQPITTWINLVQDQMIEIQSEDHCQH